MWPPGRRRYTRLLPSFAQTALFLTPECTGPERLFAGWLETTLDIYRNPTVAFRSILWGRSWFCQSELSVPGVGLGFPRLRRGGVWGRKE